MLAGLGAALYAGGHSEEAAHRLCEAADLKPADPTPYLLLGKMEKAAPTLLPCGEQKLARFVRTIPGMRWVTIIMESFYGSATGDRRIQQV